MKFLCDRCKTRYSIGDDRVRGKILKIRCKNCANVITVREGMTDVAAAGESGPIRRKNPTTNAPNASHTQSVANAARGNGALASAFASQMTKPPPALEEEWYVSIDGEQSGPFSLAEAQRWVAAKAFDADLHCWSEGFDDWLPVDKVSHFRGLRKKPAPAPAPPPMPRVAPRLSAVPAEDEAKPLFAATMAALEKSSSQPVRASAAAAPSAQLPRVVDRSGPGSGPVPGVLAKTNGSGGAPMPAAKGTPSTTPAVAPTLPARVGTKPGMGGAASPGAAALAAAFDVPSEDEGDSLTAVEAPAFSDEILTAAEAHAPRRLFERIDSAAASSAGTMPLSKASAVPAPIDTTQQIDDDSLEIGEVSRVVNLADLAKSRPQQPQPRVTARQPSLRSTASNPKYPAGELGAAGLGGLAPALPGGQPVLGGMDPIPSESIVAQAPVVAQRRGMILLLAGAGLLLAGVLGAVVWIATSDSSDDQPVGLGHTHDIDTSRPDEIMTKAINQVKETVATPPVKQTVRHYTGPQITKNPNNGPDEVTDPTKRELDPSEVEDMAAKQGDGTNFCYKRAQRGALGLEIQDLKKMQVTLTVDKEGLVGDVQLSSHATDGLGVCIANRIKGWRFRQSSGTKTFKITLVFQSG
ncbi:MAG TPA: GYF domain-containing protein [Kofleriaceae bacterium]|nr:GYF domain-containing protein [Kofleriaceae bacterium]